MMQDWARVMCRSTRRYLHNAKLAIHENNRLTMGEQKNAIQNVYTLLLTEFRHMVLGS